MDDLAKGAEAFLRGFSKHKPIAPALAAGRALGLDGPLTLEALVCNPDLGALPASPAQVALMRALDGLSIGDILSDERLIYHFGTDELPCVRPDVVYVRAGIRAAKTLIAILAGLRSILTCQFRRAPKPELGERAGPDGLVGVRPGELVRGLIVGPRVENTLAPYQLLLQTMNESPRLKALFADEPLAESCNIRRPDGNIVKVKRVAADAGGKNLRSTWLAFALFDEADFHDDEGAAVNLKVNLDACRGRMLPLAQILVPSSPWAEGSQFDKLFTDTRANQLKHNELSFHSDTVSMNPTIDRNVIARLRAVDPDVAAREYDAIPFGAGAEAFYPEDAIAKSFVRTEIHTASGDGSRVEILAPDPRFAHCAGGDMGFRKNSSALAISRSEMGRVRLAFRLEFRPEKGKSLAPSEIVREFAFWCMRYGCPAIIGDLHNVDSTHEELNKLRRALEDPTKADEEQRAWVDRVRADPFAKTAKVPTYIEWTMEQKSIADRHTEMKRRMQEGLVELAADDRMKEQARGTKRKAAGGGHISIMLPKHGMSHGDLWGSVVIACTEASVETYLAKPKPLIFPRRSASGGAGM